MHRCQMWRLAWLDLQVAYIYLSSAEICHPLGRGRMVLHLTSLRQVLTDLFTHVQKQKLPAGLRMFHDFSLPDRSFRSQTIGIPL